ncbi:MAG: glycosyltransferase family 39 protein [Acidimicrobiia bacterium]|nr:glycosyltransferase family 39 protein [Acidimicrobiia bacterium]
MADRHVTFDDGVFGASAVAMRDGGVPFRDVFSSQGPLFLPLVWIADLSGLRTLDAPRILAVASGVVLVLAVYAAGRAVTTRAGAIFAAALVASSGGILWITGPVNADGPALALATTAVALALHYRLRPSWQLAVGIGLALGAALSIKSLVLPAAVPVGIALLGPRRGRDIAAAVGAALVVGLVAAVPWGLGDVWDQSVVYHLEAAGGRTPGANLRKIASTLGDRDLLVVVAAAAAATCAVIRRLRGTPVGDTPTTDSARTTGPGIGWLLGGWLVAILLLLTLEHPLWRPHVAHLVPPLALLAAWRRPSWRMLAIVLVPALAYHVVHTTEILWPGGAPGDEAAVVTELQSLPDGALVISDDPGLAWRAGRGTPPDLVDTSILRIESGRITSESLADAVADDPQICAVVVWSAVRFGSFEELPALLEDEGFDVAARYDDSRVLYVRPDCDPGSQG